MPKGRPPKIKNKFEPSADFIAKQKENFIKKGGKIKTLKPAGEDAELDYFRSGNYRNMPRI